MIPIIRLRGPKLLGEYVTVVPEHGGPSQQNCDKLTVIIRLPVATLDRIETLQRLSSKDRTKYTPIEEDSSQNAMFSEEDDGIDTEDEDSEENEIFRKRAVPRIRPIPKEDEISELESPGTEETAFAELRQEVLSKNPPLGVWNADKEYSRREEEKREGTPSDEDTISEDGYGLLEDEDILALDTELNKALAEIPVAFKENHQTPPTTPPKLMVTIPLKIKKPLDKKPIDKNLGYRPIPINIIPLIQRELARLNPDDSDELGIIDKIVFSLKDPLAASKIRLPVKSSRCSHFECFDFENFCLFNKIPKGVQSVLKKDIARRNYEKLSQDLRANRQNSLNKNVLTSPKKEPYSNEYIKIIEHPQSYYPKVPLYKCPLCDKEFPLHELMLDDSYNYFVKSTPKETERIEILDMKLFRIVDDGRSSSVTRDEEVVVLSSDDEDDTPPYQEEHTLQDSESDLFNDGLDEELLMIGTNGHNYTNSKGSGSWEDPVMLD